MVRLNKSANMDEVHVCANRNVIPHFGKTQSLHFLAKTRHLKPYIYTALFS
jgi:hypothetical protein